MIKLFEQYKEYDQIKNWLYDMRIFGWKINDDLTVDVNGDVHIPNRNLTEFPITFNRVSGNFNCGYNKLTSLKGCPSFVGNNFDCQNNNLTSLEDLNIEFCKIFSCSDNNLTSLKGCPQIIYMNFTCYNNKLTSLEWCPIEIGGMFMCTDNEITTLKYFPKEISVGPILIGSNPLPKEVLDLYNLELLIKHQDEYGVWNTDGSFNKGRFDIFLNDYNSEEIK